MITNTLKTCTLKILISTVQHFHPKKQSVDDENKMSNNRLELDGCHTTLSCVIPLMSRKATTMAAVKPITHKMAPE